MTGATMMADYATIHDNRERDAACRAALDAARPVAMLTREEVDAERAWALDEQERLLAAVEDVERQLEVPATDDKGWYRRALFARDSIARLRRRVNRRIFDLDRRAGELRRQDRAEAWTAGREADRVRRNLRDARFVREARLYLQPETLAAIWARVDAGEGAEGPRPEMRRG